MDASQTRCFYKIKPILSHDNLLTYLDLNETFKILTEASVFQFGQVIIRERQNNRFLQ